MKMLMTKVKRSEDMEWGPIKGHHGLYHKEITDAQEADALEVALQSILWEKIDPNGSILPHYHDCAEVIHITKGTVEFLCNGEWQSFKAGDTFIVPKEVVHSVRNTGDEPSEQISVFLPAQDNLKQNSFFNTYLVEKDAYV
jgi:quercetin dioxygenase-like cupin family protein